MGDLSKHFSKHEFACKCGCGFGLNDGDVNPDLINRLEEVRSHFGKSISILSGCRCKKHNTKIGGVEQSQHLLGNAADIIIRDTSPIKVFDYINRAYLSGGVGKYKLFTHLDVRKNKAVWNG